MIKISVKHNIADTIRMLDERVRKQVPFATARALTRTAKKAERRVHNEMRQVFDRPTPWTLKTIRTKPATKRDLQAMVYLKDTLPGGKARGSASDILGHHFTGGSRQRKALEMWLTRAGLLGSNERVVPGSAARLDSYGNMSRGQVQQILSQLRAGGDPASFKSSSARSRRNVRKAGRIFWARRNTRDQHLARGAWIDFGPGKGIKPLLLAVSNTTYHRLIDMPRLVEEVVHREFPAEFHAAFADAVRTAR